MLKTSHRNIFLEDFTTFLLWLVEWVCASMCECACECMCESECMCERIGGQLYTFSTNITNLYFYTWSLITTLTLRVLPFPQVTHWKLLILMNLFTVLLLIRTTYQNLLLVTQNYISYPFHHYFVALDLSRYFISCDIMQQNSISNSRNWCVPN